MTFLKNNFFINILKLPYLRFKYRFFPNKAQGFWAQELLNSQGMTAKLGQMLAQGKISELPKSSINPDLAKKLFQEAFKVDIEIKDLVLAASMGQVFFVRFDNKEYALKILHPEIKEKLKNEISNILILGGYFAKAKGFQFNQEIFRQFLENVFAEETDLCREAHFQELFHSIFIQDKRFKIPSVISQYSNSSFLVQESVFSKLARDVNHFQNFYIFDFFLNSLLSHQLLHGDLNDRNWGFAKDQTVVIYDFGCANKISTKKINGLIKLFLNVDVKNSFSDFGVNLEQTWFRGKEQELRDALFNPLMQDFISPNWAYSQELKMEFGEKIKILRDATDPWVLLMMRSLFSLIRIYQDRKHPIPFRDLITPYLHLKEAPMQSTKIKIDVREGNSSVITLELPINTLENIQSLLPENVAKKIKADQIDINQIIKKVILDNYKTQVLFELHDNNRNYRIWIE